MCGGKTLLGLHQFPTPTWGWGTPLLFLSCTTPTPPLYNSLANEHNGALQKAISILTRSLLIISMITVIICMVSCTRIIDRIALIGVARLRNCTCPPRAPSQRLECQACRDCTRVSNQDSSVAPLLYCSALATDNTRAFFIGDPPNLID